MFDQFTLRGIVSANFTLYLLKIKTSSRNRSFSYINIADE